MSKPKKSVVRDKYPIRPPVNTMASIVQDFLEGAPFTEALCDKVTATYCISGNQVSYKKRLEFVKTVFTQSQHTQVGQTHYVIQSHYEFEEIELALMIRLLNLSYHAQRIIVLNGAIIFIPQFLRHHTEETIRIYTHQCLQNNVPPKALIWLHHQRYRLSRWFSVGLFKDHPSSMVV